MEGGNMQNTKGRANDNRNLEQDLTNKGGEINCIKAKDTISMQDEEKYTQHKGGGVLMKLNEEEIHSITTSNHRLNY